MDRVYEAAVAKRDELQRELQLLNDFIHMYRRTREVLGLNEVQVTRTQQERESDEAGAAVVANDGAAKGRITDNPKPQIVVDEAMRIILEAGRPMTRGELHRALSERGLVVRGANASKTLGTTLWRARERLTHLEGLGYWPKGVEYPAPGADKS